MTDQQENKIEQENQPVSETGEQAQPTEQAQPAVETEPAEAAPSDGKKRNKDGKTVGQEILSWVLTIVVAVAAALLIRTFIFEPVRVDGESMCDTLQNNEVMFTTKYDYLLGEPHFGDVIICKYPDRGNTKFVKRLMGLPGDTIKIIDHVVYRMEKGTDHFVEVQEDYLTPERNDGGYISNMSAYTLKDDEYFVMGDNRDNSNDSRYVGPISRDMIVAHVRFVFFPFNKIRGIK